MKKIVGIISVLMLTISCEIEELKPEDVEAAPEVVVPLPETVDPASIIVPCTPVPNYIYFDLTNRIVSNLYPNDSDLNLSFFNAGYGIWIDTPGTPDFEVYFKSQPQSGYYTEYDGAPIESGEFVLRLLYYGYYYYAVDGSTLYVQDYVDSTVYTWCDIDFEGPGGATIEQSKGKFTLDK